MMEERVCDGWMVANHQKEIRKIDPFFRVLPQRVVWLSSIKAKKKIGAESENKEGGFVFMTIADNTRRKEENI